MLEYKQHDLEDEEDEKKIFRAEARAAREYNKSSSPCLNKFDSNTRSVVPPTTNLHPNSYLHFNSAQHSYKSPYRPSGVCFSCGKPGHWRAACPLLLASRQKQDTGLFREYPSQTYTNDLRAFNFNVNSEHDLLVTADLLRTQAFEYEISSTCVVTKVKGSLKKCLHAWTEINAPKFITDIILHGYKIPFMSIPPSLEQLITNRPLGRENSLKKQLVNCCYTNVL